MLAVDFHLEHDYRAAPEMVFAMLSDPEFLDARFEATGALKHEVVQCARNAGGGFDIVTRRTVHTDIPGFARRVLPATNSLTQTEEWQAESDGVRVGTWRIDAGAVPVSTSGTTRVEPTDGGAVHHIEGTIKVPVPIIGGRLERFVFENANKTLGAEHEFGQRWLAER